MLVRSRAAVFACALALAAAARLAVAAGEAKQGGLAGKVVLSDGTAHEGILRLTRGRPLEIYDPARKRWHRLALEEIARLEASPEREEMAEGWRFLEEGSAKKLRLAFRYPRRSLLTEATLLSGAVVRGHVRAAPLYLEHGGSVTKFLLVHEQKGEPEQTLESLAYVREVVLAEPGEARALGAIRVAAPGALAIRAVDSARATSIEADRAGLVSHLLPGRYDLFVRFPSEVLHGITGTADALSEEDRAAILARIAASEEFFDEKEVKVLSGSPGWARALVELRRSRPSHMVDERGRPFAFIRWELWLLRKLGSGYEIDGRLLLFRERVAPATPLLSPRFRALDSLAGVEVKDGTTEVRLAP